MNAKRRIRATLLSVFVAILVSTALIPSVRGQENGEASGLAVHWRVLPWAPFGGRLELAVRNLGPALGTVSVNGTVPSNVTFAGPRVLRTTGSCQEALSLTSTTCTPPAGFQSPPNLCAGQTLLVDAEQMLVTGCPSGNRFTLARGINGTTAAPHVAGAAYALMRPEIRTAGGATNPFCVAGVPRAVGCSVATMPAGAVMVIVVDLGVTPGAATSTFEFDLTISSGARVVRISGNIARGFLLASAGPYRAFAPLIATEPSSGASETVGVRFGASFPETCEVAAGTTVNWSLGGWGATTDALLDDFVLYAPLNANLDGQPIATTISYSNSTATNAAGQSVPTKLALWFATSNGLPAGTHVLVRQWGPTLRDIEDGLDPTLPQGSIVDAGVMRRVVVATPPAMFPATSFPLCRTFAP